MATNKTLAPTNVTVQIPALADVPDMSVPANAIDKTIDAVNALNSQIGYTEDGTFNSASSLATLLNNALTNNGNKRKLLRFACNGSFDCFVTGVSYFVDLKVSSSNYSSCIMQGVGFNSFIVGTLSNGTWSFKEQTATIGDITTANGQYTTAAWATGTNTCTWTAPASGKYIVWMRFELANSNASQADRSTYKQLQMQGTAQLMLHNVLYYDYSVTDGAFMSRTISQPVVATAGQTIIPYVHTPAAGLVFNIAVVAMRIA